MLYNGHEFKAVFHQMILDKNPQFPLAIDEYSLELVNDEPKAPPMNVPPKELKNYRNSQIRLIPVPGTTAKKDSYVLNYNRLDFDYFFETLEKHNLTLNCSTPKTNKAYLEAIKYLLKEDLGIKISIDGMTIDKIDNKHYLSVENHFAFLPLSQFETGSENYPYDYSKLEYKFPPEVNNVWPAKKPGQNNTVTVHFAILDTGWHTLRHQVLRNGNNSFYELIKADATGKWAHPDVSSMWPHSVNQKSKIKHRLVRLSYSEEYPDCVTDGFDWQELYPHFSATVTSADEDNSYAYGNYLYQIKNKSDGSIAQSNILHLYVERKNT